MGMMKPSLNELLNKTDNRYTLVVTAAKRARQLMEEVIMSSADADSQNNGEQIIRENIGILSRESYNRAKMVRYALEDIASEKAICKPK